MAPLFRILTGCPTLEALVLEGCFPTFDIARHNSTVLINLPHLNMLETHDCLPKILLSHFRIPASAMISINDSAENWGGIDTAPVTPLDVTGPFPNNLSNLQNVANVDKVVWLKKSCSLHSFQAISTGGHLFVSWAKKKSQ